MKRLHYFSGLVLTAFVGFHLLNHIFSLLGESQHIALMRQLRVVYRQPAVETVLLGAVVIQMYSGIILWRNTRGRIGFYAQLQRVSGLYLALFLLIHVSAVMTGRFLLHLDTNFYFGVAGLNTFPYWFFFGPYYGLAVMAFFGHIAAIHAQKMKRYVVGLSPAYQANLVLVFGFFITVVLMYGLTNGFKGIEIPADYGVLIGR